MHLVDPDAETRSRRLALEAAARATAVFDEEHGNLQTSAIIAQVRSTAVDLLRGSGLTEEAATAALEDAVGPPVARE